MDGRVLRESFKAKEIDACGEWEDSKLFLTFIVWCLDGRHLSYLMNG